eukprot:TRINITY_DN4043_c0_g4_i1.p1 TRINITY_DN4043_c0_g4~~TRINITY_DN4043_c0_g4_i1.p1  ORF type:complete len:234 (+),score=24.87 TRINITY_DN4043_c0_g4_i1:79-702(+)
MSNIPKWLVGAWERKYIQRGDHEKSEQNVVVRYLQCPELFADVRVEEGERVGGRDMAFAGAAKWADGDVLEWHAVFEDGEKIDEKQKWEAIRNGTSTTNDKGRIEKINDDAWMEFGAGYTEEWHRLSTTGGHFAAVGPHTLFVSTPPFFSYVDSATTPATYVTGKDGHITRALHPVPGMEPGAKFTLPEEQKSDMVPCGTSTTGWPF